MKLHQYFPRKMVMEPVELSSKTTSLEDLASQMSGFSSRDILPVLHEETFTPTANASEECLFPSGKSINQLFLGFMYRCLFNLIKIYDNFIDNKLYIIHFCVYFWVWVVSF